jgi:hypothetical protein
MRDEGCSVSFSLHPESQSTKKNSADLWGNYDENWWWNYDEIAVKTVSKCLAPMKGCWDPEFEPSVEEIVDYRWDMAILSVRFLWRGHTLGGFPYSTQSTRGPSTNCACAKSQSCLLGAKLHMYCAVGPKTSPDHLKKCLDPLTTSCHGCSCGHRQRVREWLPLDEQCGITGTCTYEG